ncbi:ABC transporter ATP-binding protein [Enterocloster lavalensis]|uniref:ABC transporter ATP-binding protein n=1 Tax=Enterocloster lavalensis TaxID=460384 RepID=UPI001A9A357F
MLEVKGLNTFYGNLHAIWDIDIQVHEKEIVALIGSNGAGKSTLLKTIAGSLPMQSGEIIYQGERFNPGHKRKANVMVHKGITLCPEGRHIFPRMTVAENLKRGGYIRQKGDMEAGFDRVYDLFPRLKERDGQMAGTLSGGEQQMLAIGRALMSGPKLLMLDEPSLGLSPLLTEKLFELILEIRNQGTTILLVEQNAVSALSIANRGYVLKVGHITQSGTGQELLESQDILASYLGA